MTAARRRRMVGGALAAAAVLATAGFTGISAAAAPPPAPGFTLVWDQPTAAISLSTPVAATLEGQQAVVVGGTDGRLYAFSAGTGQPIAGWPVRTDAANYICVADVPCPYNATGLDGPVSAAAITGTQSSVFVEAGGGNAQSDSPSAAEPDFEAFADGGRQLYASDPSETAGENLVAQPGLGSNPGLSGVAIDRLGGRLDGFAGGTTSHLEYGIQARTGVLRYGFVNEDTSNGTPAVADIDGTPTVFEVSDSSYSPTYPGSFAGGHLRALTTTGREICNADLYAPDSHDNYAGGSFVTSPAVGTLGGLPLVVFGQGARYTGSDHIEAYDAACQPAWSRPPALAGPTNISPIIADTGGPGVATVVAETGDAAGHPVIYEISAGGRIIRSRTLSSCNGMDPYTTSQSVVAADLTGLGYQDLIAPAGTCGYAVLDGRTLQFVPTGSPSGFLSPDCSGNEFDSYSTALVTPRYAPGGTLDLTIAGFRVGTTSGCVATYAVRGAAGHVAALGAGDWPEFHQNPQLTGVAATGPAPQQDVLGPGASLPAGARLTAPGGEAVAALDPGGDLEVGRPDAGGIAVGFSTRTRSAPGAGRLTMQDNGNLVLRISGGRVLWQSHTVAEGGPTFAVIQPNGSLVVYAGPIASDEAATAVAIWSSRRGLIGPERPQRRH